jgi:hypothetical protein
LKHWRSWRMERNANRIKRRSLLCKACLWCGAEFTTRREEQLYCAADCVHAAQRSRQTGREDQPPRPRRPNAPPGHPWRQTASVTAEAPTPSTVDRDVQLAQICANRERAQSPTRAVRTTTLWGQDYQCYLEYCRHVGVAPASEDWWRCLAR